MKITFIEHSGFMVEMEHTVLLFDYYHGKIPTFDKNKMLYVFVSHSHADHYNPVIWELKEQYEKVQYIISDDVKTKENALRMKPHEKKQISEMTVETLKSNDIGVAYIVEVEGKVIYHAGDLNWWHWNGESDAFNNMIKKQYTSEISKIKGVSIDIGFVPVDPRLEDKYILAIDYLMQNVDIKHVFPMHFWQDYAIYNKLMGDPRTKEYRERIEKITKPGQVFKL